MFSVQGLDEAQIDLLIEQRKEQYLEVPDEWVVTQKNMEITKIDMNGNITDVITAHVGCLRLAGWLDWFPEEEVKSGT